MKIGGILILKAIGLPVSVIINYKNAINFSNSINDPALLQIINQNSNLRNAVEFSTWFQWFLVVQLVILCWFFFTRKSVYPTLYIFSMTATLVFAIYTHYLNFQVINMPEITLNESRNFAYEVFVNLIIWGSYLKLSKRCKSTFIN